MPFRRINPEARTVLIFNAVTVLGGLTANRLLTQFASPKALDEYFLFMNLVQWIILPATSANVYISRHWPIARAEGQTRPFLAGVMRGLGIHLLICAASAGVLHLLGVGVTSTGLALALAATCLVHGAQHFFHPMFFAERRRVMMGLFEFFNGPGRIGTLALVAALAAAHTGSWLVYAQSAHALMAACILALSFYFVIFRRTHSSPTGAASDPDLSLKGALRYSASYLFGSAVAQTCVSIERWGLAPLHSGATAQFVLSYGLAFTAISAATTSVHTYFSPIISQKASSGHPLTSAAPEMKKFFLIMGTLLAGAAFFGVVLSNLVVPLLFGPRFASVARLLPWMFVGHALFGMGQALQMIPFVVRSTFLPNAARVTSQLAYVLLLLVPAPGADPALSFAQRFVIAQSLYLALMIGLGAYLVARHRAPPTPTGLAPF